MALCLLLRLFFFRLLRLKRFSTLTLTLLSLIPLLLPPLFRMPTSPPSKLLLTMFTFALVRFAPTEAKEIQYLNAKGALTYTDIGGDPVLYGNLPPREISMKDVFRSGDSSKKFKIAEGQWYRYAPSYVSPAYHLLEG